jgi:3-deoxy-D-manno-octulosonic-acid transferase
MFRHLYSLIFLLIFPLVLGKLWWRGVQAKEYRLRRLERFGLFLRPEPALRRPIWVHAVSVGEVMAAEPIVKALQSKFPERDFVITTMTPTSSERIRQCFGNSVFHVYAPYDLPWLVNNFLRRIRPEFLMIMETELWPNMIQHSRALGCPVVVANARLSERSARGYRRLSPIIGWMLNELSMVLSQYGSDAERFRSLNISAEKIHVTGSVKYDITIGDSVREQGRRLRSNLASERVVWVAASTHEGEDERALAAHARVREQDPSAVLILVPRHPERFESVFQLSEKAGFRVYRRTWTPQIPADAEVYLLDTMGELLSAYAAAQFAFIGGSWADIGGHNPIEAAALSLPLFMGPHTFNFEVVCSRLSAAGALEIVRDEQALAESLLMLMASPNKAQGRGTRALAEVEANRGAVARVVAHVVPLLETQRIQMQSENALRKV